MCAFDLIGNNTDRKSGHVLLGTDGRIRGIDHGLMFHHEFKLRTVIWEFGGEPIPEALRVDVAQLVDRGLPEALAELLDPFERDALLTRARALVDRKGVGSGKSVSVRVDLGGCRNIKKKKKTRAK